MKYSKSAIGLLTREYRSVLKKCLLINLGLFALGATTFATPANAEDQFPVEPATNWVNSIAGTRAFMDALENAPGSTWKREDGEVTGYGVEKILTIMSTAAAQTDAAVAKVNDATVGNDALSAAIALKANASALNNYVEKEVGKGLSTEDYTTAEKTKLAGIAEGAEANVIDAITIDGVAAPKSGKTVDLGAAAGASLSTLTATDAKSVYTVAKANDLFATKDSLATVATTGNYSDLVGAPTLATVATTGNYSDLAGTPTLATVATTGNYSDLTGTPTFRTINGQDITASGGDITITDTTYTGSDSIEIDGSNQISVKLATTGSGLTTTGGLKVANIEAANLGSTLAGTISTASSNASTALANASAANTKATNAQSAAETAQGMANNKKITLNEGGLSYKIEDGTNAINVYTTEQAANTFALASHNQASNTINLMTGYSKPTTAPTEAAIAVGDSLNTAIGKLEYKADANATAITNKLDTATFNGYLVDSTAGNDINGAKIGAGTLAKAAFNTDLASEFDGKLTGAEVAYNASDTEKAGSKFYTASTIDTNFVAKVPGKGLSTEDYTTAEKTKLDGIAAGAEVNVIDAITIDGAAAPKSGKTVALGAAAGAGLTTLDSAVSGNDTVYTVAKVNDLLEGKSNTGHTHASSDVTAMTGYSKASAVAAIAADDTLNLAIGKLEYKADKNATDISTNTGAINTLNGTVDDANSVLNSIRGNAANAYFDPSNTDAGTIKDNIEAKMSTADWTLSTDATKLDGAKIGAGTVAETALATATQGKINGAFQSIAFKNGDTTGTAISAASGAAVVNMDTGDAAGQVKIGGVNVAVNGWDDKFDVDNIIVSSYTPASAEPAATDTNVYSALKTDAVIANAISAKDSVRFSKYNNGTSDVMPAFGATETVGQYLYENAANALYDPDDDTKGTIKSNISANATAIANALDGTTKFDGLKLAKNGTTTGETQTITSIDVDPTDDTTTANSAIMATKASVARDITAAVVANTSTDWSTATGADIDAKIANWVGLPTDPTSNYNKFATVGNTFAVFTDKLTDFYNDLYTGNNKFGGKQSFGTYATAGDPTTTFTENASIDTNGAAMFKSLNLPTAAATQTISSVDVDLTNAATTTNSAIMATKASVARDIKAALSDPTQDIVAGNVTANTLTLPKTGTTSSETVQVSNITTSKINSSNNSGATLATAQSVYEALGKVDKLITHNDTTDKDVMDEAWAGKSHNVVSGEYRGNLAVGTTVADDLIELDNVFGKMQNLSGTDLVAYVKEGTDAGNGSVAENLQKLNDAIHGMTGTKESVTFGDAATTTTMGNTNAKIVLSESGKTATVTAANGLIVDGKVQGGSFRNTGNSFSVDSAGQVLARNFTNNSNTFSVSTGGVLKAEQLYNNSNTFSVSSGGALTANEYSNSDGSFVVNTIGDVTAHSLTFNGTDKVSTIDTGATAVSGDGSATTMATTATVMKSAANGKYDNTTSGLTATTIQDAIDENASNIATSTVMDANATSSAGYAAGDKVNLAAKLLDVAMKNAEDDIDDIEYILGPAQTTEATSGILEGRIIGGKDTVTPTKNIKVVDAIDLIAKKAAGLETDNLFTGLNVFKNDGGIALQDSAGGNSTRLRATAKGLEVDRTVVAEGFRLGDNTVTSIDVDGSAVGVAPANANKMATGATVYLGAENALYDGATITGGSAATIKTAIAEVAGQVNTNTGDIAAIEGKITVPAAGSGSSYAAITAGDAVGSNLVALDSAVGTIQTSDTKQNKQLDTLATEIGGSYAADGTFTHTAYTSTNNIAATDPITTAISSIDAAIGDASTLNSGIAGYTGTEVVGAIKQLSANLTNGTVDANFGSTTVDSLTIDGTSYGITSGGVATFASVNANSVTTNSLKIGDAAAITSTSTGLDMGGNTLENVGSLSFGAETTSVNSIDDGSAAKTSASANNDTTMATVATVLKSAENAEFNAANATSAALNGATTIKTAIDNVAAAVDSITDGMGNVAELAAQADTVAGSNINNPVPGSSPIHATTVVSAIKDLDNAIGNIETGITHDYAKNGTTVPSSVAGIIEQVAENVYADIHGAGAGTDVTIGDLADTTTVGKITTVGTGTDAVDYMTGLQIDTTGHKATLAASNTATEKMIGIEIEASASKEQIVIGDSEDDGYGVEIDVKNKMTSIGDGTNQTKIGEGTLEIGQMVANTTGGGTHFEAGLHMDKDHITLGDMTTNGVALDATNGSITATGDANIGGNATVGGNATITGDLSAAGGNFTVVTTTDTTDPANPVTTTTMTLTGDADITGDLDVGGDADITGAATVGGTLDVTGKTTLSTANGMAFGAGQTVTSIDDGSAKATITPATTTPDPNKSALATVATVLKSAENAEYDNTANTGVVNTKGATTLHQAISVLDDAMGDMVLKTANKNLVDGTGAALDNATDALNALDAVMGNITDLDVSKGNLDGTKKEVASHLAALDSRLGLIKAIDGGAKGNLAAADSDVAKHFNSVDVAMGDRTSYNNTANFTGYVASNDGTKDLTTMISEVASNIGTADQLAGANNAGIKSTNTVNQNIMALDTALGNVDDLQQLGYGNVTEAIIGTNEVFSKAINQLDYNYRELRHDFEAGMASQAALSALVPNGRAKGDTQLSVGTGMYKGHTAAAVGGFHWFTDNLLFNAGVAWDNAEATGRLGLTYSW